MSSENNKKSLANTSEKESWSKSEETWQKVNAILNSGVVAMVDEKQLETRRYLEDVEARLTDIIKKAKIELEPDSLDLPDSAAYLPSGNVSLEIRNAIGAINMLNDKQLKFRLTTFVDDYRRILEMNREEERDGLLESLEEHFTKGSYDFVEQKEETQEMLDSLAVVEKEVKKTKDLKHEIVSRIRKLKEERDMALTFSERRKRGESFIQTERPRLSREEVASNIYEILQQPHIMNAIGVSDYVTLSQNIDMLAVSRSERKKEAKRLPTSRSAIVSPGVID